MRGHVAQLRRDHPGLVEDLSSRERADGRRILVIFISDNVQEARLQGILAKALQLRGAHIQFLVSRSGMRGRAVLKALGFRDFVYTEDFIAGRPHEHERRADEVLAAVTTTRELLQYEIDGVRVGRQALSTVIRQRLDPRIDLDDPSVRHALRASLAAAIEGIGRSARTLDATRPDELMLIERGYVSFASLFDVALVRGIPVVQLQLAHRDDALELKRCRLDNRDLGPRSLDDATWEAVLEGGWSDEREALLDAEFAAAEEEKWYLARRVRHTSGARGPEELRRRLGLDPDRPVAVLFSHVLWDASLFYWEDVYPDQGLWFSETIRLAADNDDVQWLVKLHPALHWELLHERVKREPAELAMIRDAVGALPPHMQLLESLADVDNRDLFQIIDAGVTIRGTVGVELPRLGIPVVTAGTSDYTGRGFTIDSASIPEYEANIRSVGSLERLTEEQVRTANLYSYSIFCVRPWRFKSFVTEYVSEELTGGTIEFRLGYDVRTLADLEAAGDLQDFAEWAADSDSADFVDRERLGAGTLAR
jgi:hypothetical protein